MATTTVQALKNADGNKIYPKTIADAVAYDSTRTVKGMLSNSVFCEHVKTVEDSDFPINATTLNGHTSDYFATASDLADLASGASVVDLGDGDTLKDYVGDQINIHNAAKNVHQNLFTGVSLYVNASIGSDSNNGLTQSTPFKTIQAAIDSIPVTAKVISITIMSGTYNENIVIKNRLTTHIWIGTAAESDNVIINGGMIASCCNNLHLYNMTFTKPIKDTIIEPTNEHLKFITIYNTSFNFNKCVFNNTDDSTNEIIFGIDCHSCNGVIANCTINNTNIAIGSTVGSIKCYSAYGTNNKYCFYSNDSIIMYNSYSTISYTMSKVLSQNSGLVINESAANYLNMFSNANSDNAASFHNSIYRGKDITNYLNDGTLFTRISSGTFDDLFIGDYFTMSITVEGYTVQCNKYVLCGFDTYLGTGRDTKLTKHHAVIMPASYLFKSAIVIDEANEKGYYNTTAHSVIMPKIATGIKAIIGNHLIKYQDVLATSISDDDLTQSDNWDWKEVECRLCNEIDIWGSSIWGNGYDIGISNKQLPIFKLNTAFDVGEVPSWTWLCVPSHEHTYVGCTDTGYVDRQYGTIRTDGGIRPKFLID